MIRFGRETCTDLGLALEREWLVTNGLGGYAASTIVGLNTRRYHALLVAAARPPVARVVLLSKLDEALLTDDGRYDLGANQYPGAIHPRGSEHLDEFRLDPFPVFVYRCGGVTLEKSVFMVHGRNATVIRYCLLEGPGRVRLEVRPFLAGRDHHHTMRAAPGLEAAAEVRDREVRFAPCGHAPELWLTHTGAVLCQDGHWYYDFEYEQERRRGLSFREDLWSPGIFELALQPGQEAAFIASYGEPLHADAADLAEQEVARCRELPQRAPQHDELASALVVAADAFPVSRDDGRGASIIAGYPWFGDWGRDALISLPGLLLCTGRHDLARDVLRTFAGHCRDGLVPNCFRDDGAPEYNSVDASLWFVHAARRYYDYTGDLALVAAALLPALKDIIRSYAMGTRFNIGADDDGLLRAGDVTTQLTWMDAKVGDWVVTPRHGKAVEVNALWYNALRHMEYLSGKLGNRGDARAYGGQATRVRQAFETAFWNAETGCLYDCLTPDGPDPSLRPNQIFAVSLPYAAVGKARWEPIVRTVTEHLLTPYGLRSLSPRAEGYAGVYEGNQWSRDAAYHQGTVWAWLMGPYVSAYLKTYGRTPETKRRARELLTPFHEHLQEAGLGQVSEVFDGDEPHWPKGCIAQAWSVAELLRVLVEEIGVGRPARG